MTKKTKKTTTSPAKVAKPARLPETSPEKEISRPMSKSLAVLEALGREQGITIDEMTEMTGWQPHSARGFLSNLRKKLKAKGEDSQIVKYTRDGKTMYKLESTGKADE
jgi:predicted transcriptional regulator